VKALEVNRPEVKCSEVKAPDTLYPKVFVFILIFYCILL